MHHTFADTKRIFIQHVSTKMEERSYDIRDALVNEKPYAAQTASRQSAGAIPEAPTRPTQKLGESENKYNERIDDYDAKITRYKKDYATWKYDKETLDIEFRSEQDEFRKRNSAY